MSAALVSVCLWAVAANAIAMLPSRDAHRRAAYGLIALGIPLLGWVTRVEGPLAGLVALAAGVSILRWPVWYLGRWLAGRLPRRTAIIAEGEGK